MATMDKRSQKNELSNRSVTERALAILAVDGIQPSARGRELLLMCERGEMNFEQAREDVVSRAKAMAAAQKKLPDAN